MRLRDNFKQAAKELMDGTSRTQDSAPAPAPASTDVPELVPEFAIEEAKEMKSQDPPKVLDGSESPGSGLAPLRPESTTIIAAGTIIRGSIESDCDVELYGEVQGDIATTRDLKLKGKIRGNATGGNVELYSIRMVGNVTASGTRMSSPRQKNL